MKDLAAAVEEQILNYPGPVRISLKGAGGEVNFLYDTGPRALETFNDIIRLAKRFHESGGRLALSIRITTGDHEIQWRLEDWLKGEHN